MSKTLFKATAVVMVMTLLSRISGFARDVVTAHLFGATGAFDAFAVAFKIPNFMRRLFAEGSFSQAFVPVLAHHQKKSLHAEVHAFINAMAGTLGLVLFIVTICGILGAPLLIRIFAPGFDQSGERFELAVTLLRITFPYLLFISLTAFSGAILNTYQRFWVAAFTPIFLNLCMIGAAIFLSKKLAIPIMSLAFGVFIAGMMQLLFQWPFLKKLQLLPRPVIDFQNPGVRRVLRLMVPALFGVSVGQINLLIDTLFASLLSVGSVSWLYYSDRLVEFPLGVLGVAISTVILPHLSRQHALESVKQFSSTLDWALRMVFIFGIPAMLGLILASGCLLSTLFQYGHFDAHAVLMTRRSLIAFSLGIVPFMLVKIFASAFYAKQNIKTPMQIGVIAMVANMLLNVVLIWSLAHAGIALATALSAWINAAGLFYLLKRYDFYRSATNWRIFMTRLLFANGILFLWLWIGLSEWQIWLMHTAQWRIMHLVAWLFSSVLLYLFALWISGMRIAHLMER